MLRNFTVLFGRLDIPVTGLIQIYHGALTTFISKRDRFLCGNISLSSGLHEPGKGLPRINGYP
ncbi:hypothetical protein D3C86_2120870 [compost metagenome]